MSKGSLYILVCGVFILTVFIMTACNKDSAPAAAPANYNWVEEFDTLANALAKGWAVSNNSSPIGVSSWEQGKLIAADPVKKAIVNSYPFVAHSATYSGKDFTIAGYNSCSDTGTISCWLISPLTRMKDGDKIAFYTRSVPDAVSTNPDRLQVWLNPINNSVNVGNKPLQNGDFVTKMLDINPTYLSAGPGSYPRDWTRYEITISGMTAPVDRRFGFRYFVERGGPGGSRSYGVGIDKVEFISK